MFHLCFIYTNFTIINIITKRSYCFNLLKIKFIPICFIFSIFLLNFIFPFWISFISFLVSLVLMSLGKIPSIDFVSSGFKISKASTCFFPCFFFFFQFFTERRMCKLNLFYYSTLIRCQDFFACSMFIFINFAEW